MEKQQELDELFTQVLAALSQEGLITLGQVMQDGTKSRRWRAVGVIAKREPFAKTSGSGRDGDVAEMGRSTERE